MEVAMEKFCFWFNVGNDRTYIPACRECNSDSVVIEASESGCMYDEYGSGIKKCNGICVHYVVFKGKLINGFKSDSLIKALGKTRQIDYQDVVDWQRSGRRKKGSLVQKKGMKEPKIKAKKMKGDGIHKLSDFVIN